MNREKQKKTEKQKNIEVFIQQRVVYVVMMLLH